MTNDSFYDVLFFGAGSQALSHQLHLATALGGLFLLLPQGPKHKEGGILTGRGKISSVHDVGAYSRDGSWALGFSDLMCVCVCTCVFQIK